MTLDEIKAAVDAGQTVYCGSPGYVVIKDSLGQYLVKCVFNNYYIGLTWQDGMTLNGKNFFMEGAAKEAWPLAPTLQEARIAELEAALRWIVATLPATPDWAYHHAVVYARKALRE